MFDNSEERHELSAEKTVDGNLNIINLIKFDALKYPMTTIEKQIEERNRILIGLEKAYKKLVEFKKQKNTELVIMRNNKIVKIKPV